MIETWALAGLLIFGSLFALLLLGVPVAYSLAIVGTVGLYLEGGLRDLYLVPSLVHDSITGIGLLTIPLFVLMAELLRRTKMPAALFAAVEHWLVRLPGRLPVATVVAGAIFGAMTGSSIASTAVLARTSLGQMIELGYDRRLAVGVIVSSGTLALIIPPSLSLILFGLITGTSIGELFMAGVIPGLLLAFVFAVYASMACIRRDRSAGRLASGSYATTTGRRSGPGLRSVLPIFVVIVAVLGSIYCGITTTTEAAAVGVALALVLGLGRRELSRSAIGAAFASTATVTGYILLILVCSRIFTQLLSLLEIPGRFASSVLGTSPEPLVVALIIAIVYLVLGMLMDGISLIVLLTPIFFPILSKLGFDPVWQGIFVTILIEIGLITPPVGINLFTVSGIAREFGMRFDDLIAGALPFVFIAIAFVVVITLFPQLVLWLPATMKS